MELARQGVLSEEIEHVARVEGVEATKLARLVAEGRVVILKSSSGRRKVSPVGIGEGLRVKVNANVGSSPFLSDLDLEVRKARAAVEAGADTVMDLSTSKDLRNIRRRILEAVSVPVGTVPIYQVFAIGAGVDSSEDEWLNVVEEQAKEGVDFMTIHAGVTYESLERVRRVPRVAGVVSRGGCMTLAWMAKNGKENPYYAYFDNLLDILKEYEVTISIGDGLRPGSILDAEDELQMMEVHTVAQLVKRCREAGVQAMVEGPGHVPIDKIPEHIRRIKEVCYHAPLYVLGPLVTDVAAGYDHIAAAIGGAIAALHGADFLCYVTPSEHIGLPLIEEVVEGVVAAKIAAHAVDLVKRGEQRPDLEISKARARLDWEAQRRYAIYPPRFDELRAKVGVPEGPCTMCGEWCVYRLIRYVSD
ncbi:phosphomethylpyrimidine synthase ThiC [archaeon]|nr:phosphomethylpyrimidine synthase ThiC [archaeon]